MQGRKAIDLKVLDLTAVCDFTDYFLVCSASNERQAQAIADAVLKALKPLKVRPLSVEGYNRAHWVLLDFGDFLVHIFEPDKRNLYALERLWGDAPDVTAKLAPATA